MGVAERQQLDGQRAGEAASWSNERIMKEYKVKLKDSKTE